MTPEQHHAWRERQANRVESGLNSLNQRIARIITKTQKITVTSHAGIPAPAALSDNDTIIFNHQMIHSVCQPKDLADRTALTLAFGFHEIGHQQHTPSLNCPEFINLQHNESQALNVMEDSRQEALMAARYPKLSDYLRLIASRAILNGGKTPAAEAWVLLYGRRTLFKPSTMAKLRKAAATKFGEANVLRGAQIIDQFMGITPITEADRHQMAALAKELSALLHPKPQATGCMATDGQRKRGGLPAAAQREQNEQAKKKRKEWDKKAEKEEQEEAESQKQEEESKEPGESPKPTQGQGQPSEQQADWDEQNDAMSSLKGEGQEAESKLENEIQEQMAGSKIGGTGDDGESNNYPQPITGDQVMAAKIERLFKRPMLDLRMEDRRRQRSGRLDRARVVQAIANDDSRIFRRRKMDQSNDVKMAIHISLDHSSSMSDVAHPTRAATWALARGIERAGHVTKVSVFSNGWRILKDWDNRILKPITMDMGGTSPLGMLNATYNDFFRRQTNGENDARQVFIIITDGGWTQDSDCDAVIMDLKKIGVHVVLVNLEPGYAHRQSDPYYQGLKTHGATQVFTVADVSEMVTEMVNVTQALAKATRERVLR